MVGRKDVVANPFAARWTYRVAEPDASGASFSVTSIYVPHGSVKNAIFVRVFGTTRGGASNLTPSAAILFSNSSRFLTSKPR